MARFIVTGASGFIGTYLVNKLLNSGNQVYSIVRNNNVKKELLSESCNHIIIESDLETLSIDKFPDVEYEAWFHLAWAGVNRDEINIDAVHKNNYNNAKICLELCKDLNCKIFIDAGSRAEYGLTPVGFKEDCMCIPYNSYSRYKLRFYKHTMEFTNKKNIKYIHLRLFSVIGYYDHPWSLISTACHNLNNNENMSMGACTQLWNFMDVRDAVSAIYEVYKNINSVSLHDNKIINIASYDTRILRSFIEEIRIITNSQSKLLFDETQKSVDIVPDIAKLTNLTGWQAQFSFRDSIIEILSKTNRNIGV